MFKIGKLIGFSSHYKNPDATARSFANTAIQYYRVAHLLNRKQWEEFFVADRVLYPTMHQTLELLIKALALKVEPGFSPERYSHDSAKIVRYLANKSQVFDAINQDKNAVSLLKTLEKAYRDLRYGQAFIQDHGVAWPKYNELARLLFAELEKQTNLRLMPEE